MIPYRWKRGEAIEVCLEALATGRVHGFSPDHDPALLADDSAFAQNGLGKHGMVRDWGLFEAHFGRRDRGQPWRCDVFVVQAHRMRKPPRWRRLRAVLDDLGHELGPAGIEMPGSEYFRVAASGSQVCVDTGSGRVMKISVPAGPPLPHHVLPWPAARRGLRAVAVAGEHTWAAWLDSRPQPAPYLVVLSHLHRDEPDRRDLWTAFGLRLLDRARESRVWPDDEWAWRWARFVLDRPGTVPVGEVSRVCLAAVPMTPAEAAGLPRNWRDRTPEVVRRSRTTLALLRCAADDVPAAPPAPPELAVWRPLLRHVG